MGGSEWRRWYARVAIWKMEGYTNEEIAGRLKCATRTVERKLFLIRRVLEDGEVTG